MKLKRIIWILVLAGLGYAGYKAFTLFYLNGDAINSIYLVPDDAVFFLEMDKPLDNMNTLSKSDIWAHFQTNETMREMSAKLIAVDSLFKEQQDMLDMLGERQVIMSAHMITASDFAFLYIVDLQKLARLELIKTNMNQLVDDGFTVTKRTYKGKELIEITSKKTFETLTMTFIENQMVASYTHNLVEKSVDQYQSPVIGRDLQFLEIQREVKQQDLFRLYLNHKYLKQFYASFSSESSSIINTLAEHFTFSGFHVNEDDDELLIAQGYATGDAVLGSLITAMDDSGTGSIDATSILPQETALYFSLGFDDFVTVHDNFYSLLVKQEPQLVNEYNTSRKQLEQFLKIDLEQDFYSWVDDEIAFAKANTPNATEKDGLAVVFKTKDTDDAIEGLDKIREQIRKRTPVKFKTVSYRDHDINYLDIKGFFKLILGKLFKDIEKPYYTVVDEYVVFSNSPRTLKLFIDSYEDEKTLAQSAYYRDFIDHFSSSSNVFLYINTNELSDAAKPSLTATTRKELAANEDFYSQFTQLGMELKAQDNLFYSKLMIHYDADYDAEALRAERRGQSGAVSDQDAILDKETIFNIPAIFPDDFTAKFYEKKYRSGKVEYKVYLKDGKPHGRFNAYYPNGDLKISGRYKDGKQKGLWKSYTPDGELFFKGRF